jgi:hypothetical protein
VQAIGSVGSVITITAAVPGYTSGTGTVTIANSGFFVESPGGLGVNFTTYSGLSTTLTILSARLDSNDTFAEQEALAPGYALNIPLTSSAPSVGTVPSSVAFNGGSSSVTTSFVAGSTATGLTTITVGPLSPFTTPSVGASLVATVDASGLTPPAVTIGNNLQAELKVPRLGDTTNIAQVTITSLNPSQLLFSTTPTGTPQGSPPVVAPPSASITVKIPAGGTSTPAFYAHAYGSSGSVSYTAYADGYGTATSTVTLAPSGLVIQSPFGTDANFSATIDTIANLVINTASMDGNGHPLALQAVAANASITATVTAANPSLGTISGSPVTITTSFGADSTTYVTYQTNTNLGSTTITAASPGYGSATVTVTVNQEALLVSDDGGTYGGVIGQFLEATGQVIVPGGGPIQVTVQSNSSNLMLSNDNVNWAPSITVTVPANTAFANFFIESLASSGQGSITASTAGFGPGTDTISMVPSGIVIVSSAGLPSFNASVSAGAQQVLIYTAQLNASNTPVIQQNLALPSLVVSLGDSNSAAGTFPASATIQAGTDVTSATFTPVAPGSTTLSVMQPTGFATPTALTSVAVTVKP